ncbi:MAG: response regulator [Deltaproteobacteria bacterium]|nr:response regulator [Deltaproteobacteria bacterium]
MRAYVRGVLKERYSCSSSEVASGFEALRLLPRERFDLVVTDINMPDINGLELVRFIRGSERHKDVPLLIISTQTSEQSRKRALDLGADAFLAKPFEPETLVEAVDTLFNRRDGLS